MILTQLEEEKDWNSRTVLFAPTWMMKIGVRLSSKSPTDIRQLKKKKSS